MLALSDSVALSQAALVALSTRQGHHTDGEVIYGDIKKSFNAVNSAVNRLANLYTPWQKLEDKDTQGEEDLKNDMPQLIKQWYEVFAPEELVNGEVPRA